MHNDMTYRMLCALPTLCVGQAADLKLENSWQRVWVCRVTGMIEIEECFEGQWKETGRYPKGKSIIKINDGFIAN